MILCEFTSSNKITHILQRIFHFKHNFLSYFHPLNIKYIVFILEFSNISFLPFINFISYYTEKNKKKKQEIKSFNLNASSSHFLQSSFLQFSYQLCWIMFCLKWIFHSISSFRYTIYILWRMHKKLLQYAKQNNSVSHINFLFSFAAT